MESEQTPGEFFSEKERGVWNSVTPLSKYLAMALFVALPFIGGWVGYTFAPDKVVEVERVVLKESVVESEISSNVTTDREITQVANRFDLSSEGTLIYDYPDDVIMFKNADTGDVVEVMKVQPSPNVYVFRNKIYTSGDNGIFEIDPFLKTEVKVEGTDLDDARVFSPHVYDETLYFVAVTNILACDSPQVSCDSHLYKVPLSGGDPEHLIEVPEIFIRGYSVEDNVLYLANGWDGRGCEGLRAFAYDGKKVEPVFLGGGCEGVSKEDYVELDNFKQTINEKVGNLDIVYDLEVLEGKLKPGSDPEDFGWGNIHVYNSN